MSASRIITHTMIKAKIFILLSACLAIVGNCYAQSSSSQDYANSLVSNVTDAVDLLQEQLSALQSAAMAYVTAAETANTQYAANDSLLIVAKRAAWQEYQIQFRQVLTNEQYATYMQQQEVRRQELLNRIKQNQ